MEQVEVCFDVVSKGYELYMHAVKTLDLQEHLSPISPPSLPHISSRPSTCRRAASP